MTDTIDTANLLRQIGFFAVFVGLVWAVQLIAFGSSAGLTQLSWVLGAATIAGAGVGAVFASAGLRGAPHRA